jgi:hypothetical protein
MEVVKDEADGYRSRPRGTSLLFCPPRGLSGRSSEPPRAGRRSKLQFWISHISHLLLVSSNPSLLLILVLCEHSIILLHFICIYFISTAIFFSLAQFPSLVQHFHSHFCLPSNTLHFYDRTICNYQSFNLNSITHETSHMGSHKMSDK